MAFFFLCHKDTKSQRLVQPLNLSFRAADDFFKCIIPPHGHGNLRDAVIYHCEISYMNNYRGLLRYSQ
jgi:hypothetical protein